MRIIKYWLVVILLGCFESGFSQKLDITHLTGNFYVYTTYKDIGGRPFPSNGLYLVTGNGVVLIDTPWDETQFQPLLDSILKRHHAKPVLCIATHYHDDRTAGLEYFRSKGIQTYTSKQTLDLCKKHHEKKAEFSFKKDTVFNVGGNKIQTFYPGKGHTQDNIIIWFEQDKVLYGGCFVKSTQSAGLGNIADADLKAWPKSMRKLIKKFPRRQFIIPGHQSWTNNKSLEHTLKLLEQN